MPAIDFVEESTIDFQEESAPAIDFQPEGKSDKYLAMQAEKAALEKKDAGSTTMKVLEFAEGVIDKAAHPVRAIMDFPVHVTQALGGEAQTVSQIPIISPEAAKKAVEFFTPGGAASEGTLGQAAQEFAAELISGTTTPEMVGTLAVGTAAPEAIARYFQAQMLSQVPASVEAAIEAEPGKEKTKAILGAAANVVLPALIEKGLTAPKTAVEARAAQVGPATAAVVKDIVPGDIIPEVKLKGKEATESPLEPLVPPVTAAGEPVKPVVAELPATTERSLPISTTPVEITQPAMAERITELRAPDTTGLATAPPAELLAESPKPEMVGMGGAIPAEYSHSRQTPTGIRNAIIDQDLARLDLPPRMAELRREFDVVWDQAMAKMDRDPGLQDRLVKELADKPRSVSDTEVAMLAHRKVDLENEHAKATRAIAQAFDDGRMEDVALEQVREAGLRDQIHEFSLVATAVGTEQARGLSARRLLVFEDFTLAKMELDRRAAKGGEQLTPEERAEVVTLQQKIETTQKAYDAYVAKTQQQISALEVKAALQAATQKAQADVPPKVLEIAKRIVNNLHREADAARERLKSQGVKFGSGPLHELPNIRDYAIIGADHLVTGGVEFAKWSGRMVKEFGEGIKPHLEAIFDESQKVLNTIDKNSAFVQPTKRARAKPDAKESQLSYEKTKAQREWKQKLDEERQSRLPAAKKAFGMAAETLNLSRAIITSSDLSAVGRQGGWLGSSHPLVAAKAFPTYLRAFQSEAKAHASELEIRSRSNYPTYLQSGLYLAEHGGKLDKMEEAFRSRLVEKIPFVAGSGRGYTAFLNRLRADVFDALEATLTRTGKATPEEARDIAHYINVATGRGSLKAGKLNFEQAGPALATAFFSPRYQISRFQLLAGSPMWRATPRVRKLIAKEYARSLTGIGIVMGLGYLAGGEIEKDTRSSDAGKLRFGNTRIDPFTGLQQGTVLISRLASGETKTIRGKINPIRGEKVPYGSPNAAEVMGRFLRTKLSPAFGAGVDIVTGENVVGEPVTPGLLAENLLVPLSFRDVYDAMKEQGVPEGEIMALLSLLGMGVQTYEPRK